MLLTGHLNELVLLNLKRYYSLNINNLKKGDTVTLKSDLKEIDFDTVMKQNELSNIVERMLNNIGSTDPQLRDDLIFNTLGKFILGDYLDEKQMEYITLVCLDNLFLGIDEIKSDLVFTRSFSSLIIGLLLQKDRQKQFLPDEIVLKVINKSNEYLNREKDIRGYVEVKGWAHSIAHGADLLTESVKHPRFNNELSSEYLETIKDCLFKEGPTKTPFIDDEEERLIFVLEALIDKGLTEFEINTWLLEISNTLNELKNKEGFSSQFFWKRSNVINFLRGFYFRLLYKKQYPEIRDTITKVLEQWHTEVYREND